MYYNVNYMCNYICTIVYVHYNLKWSANSHTQFTRNYSTSLATPRCQNKRFSILEAVLSIKGVLWLM